MRVFGGLLIALAVWALAGCGQQGSTGSTRDDSGIVGRVHLGPQCPVEEADHPCPDKPPSGSEVTVEKHGASDLEGGGPVVARATTDADGLFHVRLTPGTYVVTADAGMSCEPVAARVDPGAEVRVDVHCDTGIR